MAISPDLLLAILAMDSYNRGYNRGLDVEGDQIGNALLTFHSDTELGSVGVNASFFAQAYQLADGNTVISYRGTDQVSPSWQDWTLGPPLSSSTAIHAGAPLVETSRGCAGHARA